LPSQRQSEFDSVPMITRVSRFSADLQEIWE